MNNISKLKQKIKLLAVQIREKKSQRKGAPHYGEVPGLRLDRFMARHFHIAYCMLRGRKYEEIEKKCHVKPDTKLIERIMEDYRDEEDVRLSA